MRFGGSILFLAGCNQVFGVEATILIDAAILVDADPDRDDDGVSNEDDNCPDQTNAEQHDEDGDSIGDGCDLCALDASLIDADADGDGIGDACDPHPAAAVDCLRLFDSFRTYAASDWLAVPGSRIDPGLDELRLRINAGSRTGIAPAGIVGPSGMRIRFASVTLGNELRLLDRSDPSNTDDGHQCQITSTTVSLVNVVFGAPPITSFTPPLVPGAAMTATLAHDLEEVSPQFSCHPSPALNGPMRATIYAGVQGNRPMIVGLGAGTDLIVAAVAVYGPKLNGTCAAAVIR